jgi:ATP-dependent Lon protease
MEMLREEFHEFTEFQILSSFNELKSKEFLGFREFKAALVKKQAKIESKENSNGKAKLVLVSGVPGSGKTSLGKSLTQYFC